jgi:hypothetical protein
MNDSADAAEGNERPRDLWIVLVPRYGRDALLRSANGRER